MDGLNFNISDKDLALLSGSFEFPDDFGNGEYNDVVEIHVYDVVNNYIQSQHNVPKIGLKHYLNFDGEDDYVRMDSDYVFTINHTISMWIKPSTFVAKRALFGNKDTAVDGYIKFRDTINIT